jgi:hypothetical protein
MRRQAGGTCVYVLINQYKSLSTLEAVECCCITLSQMHILSSSMALAVCLADSFSVMSSGHRLTREMEKSAVQNRMGVRRRDPGLPTTSSSRSLTRSCGGGGA